MYGDRSCSVERVASLAKAGPGAVSLFADARYRKHLQTTRASVVILARKDLPACPVAALVLDNPRLGFARAAALLSAERGGAKGIHPTASISADAVVHRTARVSPNVVIESGARIEAGVFVGPCCVIGSRSSVGEGSRLVASVTLHSGVQIGKGALVHPGAVIGADGFGFIKDGSEWVKVPQLGGVCIGDDVEIGANTTIDRGTIEDTVIENGVKIDNQVQVGHNVFIGAHTAIAGCVGIAGSVRIGQRCQIHGAVAITDHVEIADDVELMATSVVVKSIPTPGVYSSVLPVEANQTWLKNLCRLRQLDAMARRLKALEKRYDSILGSPASVESDHPPWAER